MNDLRFALRQLVKSPAFTLAAVIVLAFGIGLNTSLFSMIYAVLFSPRPFPEPQRVVQLYSQDERDVARFQAFSYTAFREVRSHPEIFQGVLAHTLTAVGVGDGAESRRAFCALVSSNYFSTLQVPLVRGRAFTAEEEIPGAQSAVVIASHRYWQRTGLRPDLLGSDILINGRPFTVVGIAPENFAGTMMVIGPELYFPLGVFDSLNNDFEGQKQQSLEKIDAFNLFLVGRLAPGISPEAANAALAGIADGLEQLHPVAQRDQNFLARPLPRLGTDTHPQSDAILFIPAAGLLFLSGAVLLLVCFNLASLLHARGQARRKEFAIRLALGGGRWRLIRQLLVEGSLLSLAGGALGLVLAHAFGQVMVAALEFRVPVVLFYPGADNGFVLGATLTACALATAGFALGPALKLSRGDILTDLKGHAAEDVTERRSRWMPRHPLLVAQIALSLALLVSAGLFVRIAREAIAYETGYRADDTVLVEVDASLAGYDEARTRATYRAMEDALSALPGVKAAALGALVPQGMIDIHHGVRRAGVNPPPDAKPATAAEGRAYTARWNSVGADYFEAVGIPVVAGRAFTAAEAQHPGAPLVAIIDEVLARKLWPEGNALGQRLQWSELSASRLGAAADDAGRSPTMEIVGICGPTRDDYGQREAGNGIYVPYAQGFMSTVHFHVRPEASNPATARALLDPVRRALQATAPGVPVFKVTTFREHRDSSLEVWGLGWMAALSAFFSVIALVIAAVGLYGVKAHAVSRRTREIGIRLALGAEPRRVRNLILVEGLRLTAVGIGFGLLLGGAIGKFFSSLFLDLPAFDPLVFGGAALALALAAFLASFFPARRATQVDPMVALRSE